MKYKLDIINQSNYKLLPRVRVIEIFYDEDVSALFWNSESDSIIAEMAQWCELNECGHRTSYDTFKFRNQDQLLMFVLRWS